MLEPGSLIAGKLRVEAVLGQGGMGTVVVATHVGLEQRVAIKVLHPELANQQEVVARFVREARASAKLKSEHVCRVSDVGSLETGEPYIEMELLEGTDLAQLIAQAPLTVEAAADYVVQACVAIAEAHQLGIIHRDLKPANLFVTRRVDGSALVKVLDFGIATAPSSSDFKITKTTTVMGSPGYMSPEHLRSARDVDARSDIWALGVILYEAVTGVLPFSATTITELAVKVVMDEPAPLTSVDPRFAAIVAKCLQKDPALRYQSVAELAMDLAPLGSSDAQATAMVVAKLIPGASQPMAIPNPTAVRSAAALAATGVSDTGPPADKARTTLGSASGSATMPPPDKKKSKAPLYAVAALLVGGGAVAAVVVATGGGKDKPAAHDGSAAVATTLADAAVAMPADAAALAIDAGANELADLQALAQAKDWDAILTIGKHHVDDPAYAPIITDAAQHYTKQQLETIGEYAKRGDCGSAKSIAKVASTMVPAEAAAFTKAATCTAKPKPTPDLADQAEDAYESADYAKAEKLAEQALAKNAKDVDALRVAARAACQLKDADKATAYIAKLDARDRKAPLQVCAQQKVKLGPLPGEPAKPDPNKPDPNKPPQWESELAAAKAAMQARNYTNAMSAAQKVLATQPEQRDALRILGVSACNLKQFDLAQQTALRAPPPVARQIRVACRNKARMGE